MGIKLQIKTLDLLMKIINGEMNKIKYIDYVPQKQNCNKKKNGKPFPRSTPEEQGISSKYLLDFMKAIDDEESILTQGIMIVRNGAVILEGAYLPYDLDTWRITHSMCKSLIGIAVGIAIEENYLKLNDTIASIFNKESHFLKAFQRKNITVENLLEMSSGVGYNEIGSLIDTEWTKSFQNALITFEPGSEFAYNSMNTYMLSAIIQERTKQNVVEFLEKRLFEPLGIEQICWEKSPENIIKGGWGLYITLEDRTKLGQLFLNKGKWDGKQIVSEQWLKRMAQKHQDTPVELNEYGYGYQGWIGKSKGAYIMNGILGQNVIIMPEINMVISVISSNIDMFVKSKLVDIIESYFMGNACKFSKSLPRNPFRNAELKNYLSSRCFLEKFATKNLSLKKAGWHRERGRKRSRFSELIAQIPEGVQGVSLRECTVWETKASVVPLFIQTLQNNFSKGISKLQFQWKHGDLQLHLEEHDLKFRIPIGFQKPKYSVIDVHGELYQISAWGRMAKTEDDVPVLDLQIGFLETTNCRTMRFYFEEDGIRVKVKEYPEPGKVLNQAISVLHFSLPAGGLETIKNFDAVQNKITQMVEPEFKAFFVKEQEHENEDIS